MGLNHVTVEDERGDRIRSMIADPGVLDSLITEKDGDSRFPILNQVDPYGDTLFNRIQVEQLINELKALLTEANKPSERSAIREIIDLATDALVEPHRFLRLHGD